MLSLILSTLVIAAIGTSNGATITNNNHNTGSSGGFTNNNNNGSPGHGSITNNNNNGAPQTGSVNNNNNNYDCDDYDDDDGIPFTTARPSSFPNKKCPYGKIINKENGHIVEVICLPKGCPSVTNNNNNN